MKYISQKQLQDKMKSIDFTPLIAKEKNGRMRIRLYQSDYLNSQVDPVSRAH